MTPVEEMVAFVVGRLVQHPDGVSVGTVESEDGPRIQLKVHGDDMGRVIGRGGRTARALRTLVSTASGKAGSPVMLDILD